MSKLSIPTTKENIGGIYLSGNNLAYSEEDGTTESGRKEVIVNEGFLLRSRPIHCSELYNKLRERGWNIMGNKFVRDLADDSTKDSGFNVCYKITEASDEIDQIDTVGRRADSVNNFSVIGSRLTPEVVNEINRLYNELFGNMNATEEISFYNSSRNIVDILNGVIVIDLLRYNTDAYTNTISLNELINYSAVPGISGKVDLVIQYSKAGHVYSQDFTFCAFRYDSEPSLVMENKIETINDDVEIEFVGGIIRVSPLSSNIDECIINNCTVTYGNIEQQ